MRNRQLLPAQGACKNQKVTTNNSQKTVRAIDLSLICLPAIQRAAYSLSEHFDVSLARKSEGQIELTIVTKAPGTDLPTDAELDRLLLDFALRVDIEERTRAVKTEIVAAALRHVG